MSAEELNEISEENGLTRFLMKAKQGQEYHQSSYTSEDMGESAVLENFHYDYDYKPNFEGAQKVVYSHNELLNLLSEMSEPQLVELAAVLPNKKFWRLPVNGANQPGRRNAAKSQEDRNGKGGRNKYNKNRRQSKKLDKDPTQEFLALEQQLQSTGNPMADFENWRKQMKELERKKKGLETTGLSENEGSTQAQSSSSISDFFNLKSVENKDLSFDELESGPGSEKAPSLTKSGSSRFSSFFQSDGQEFSSDTAHKIAEPPTAPSSSETIKPVAASKLLSLFSESKNVPENTAGSPQLTSNSSTLINAGTSVKTNATINEKTTTKSEANESMFLKNLISKSNQGSIKPEDPAVPPGLTKPSVNLLESQEVRQPQHSQHSQRPQQPQPRQLPQFQQIQPPQQLQPTHQSQQRKQREKSEQVVKGQNQNQRRQQVASIPGPQHINGMVQPPPGFPMGIPPHMMPPPMNMPPQHYQGNFAMPPPPPPGMGHPQVMGNRINGRPEQFIGQQGGPLGEKAPLQQQRQHPHAQQPQPRQHSPQQSQQRPGQDIHGNQPQYPYGMPGMMPMNYGGQNMPSGPLPPHPSHGFPPGAFSYAPQLVPSQVQKPQQSIPNVKK